MSNNPTIKERLTKVETLLDYIIKNDLAHVKKMLYALLTGMIGYILYGVTKSVFF